MSTSLTTPKPLPAPRQADRVRPAPAGRRWPRPWRYPAVLIMAPTVLAVHHYGVGWLTLAAFGAWVTLGVAVPGTLLWRATQRQCRSLVEDVPPGLAVGYALEVLGYLAARAVGAPLLVLAVPVGVVTSFLAVRRLRRYWRSDPGADEASAGWLWTMAGIIGLMLLWTCVAYLRVKAPPYSFNDGDLPYHLALIGDLRHHVPPQVPWVAGEPLRYHWFGYLDVAATSWVTGIEAETLLLRLYHLPMVACLPVLIGVAARRLTGRWWPGLVAAAITCFGIAAHPYGWAMARGYQLHGFGPVDDGSLLRLGLWISVTQTFAAVVCIPLVILLVDLVRGRGATAGETPVGPGKKMPAWPGAGRDSRWWAMFTGLVVVMTGAKATYLPIILCGLGVVLVLTFLTTRRLHRPALAGAALVLAATVFAQLVLLRGVSHGMRFDPLGSLRLVGAAAATGLDQRPVTGWALAELATVTVLVWAGIWCAAGGALVRRRWTDPAHQLLLGMGLAGMGAVLTFSHWGHGETWFLVAARPYLALLAAAGLAALVPAGRCSRWQGCLLGYAVAVGAGLAWLIASIGPDRAPSVEDDGRPAVLLAIAWPYLALLTATLAGAPVLAALRAEAPRLRPLIPALLVAAVAGYGVPALVTRIGTPLGEAVRAGFRAEPGPPSMMPPGVRAAGRWLRDHSAPDDLVATNAHCRPSSCNNTHFWFAAFTERRFLVEGWGFTPRTNALGRVGDYQSAIHAPFWQPRRLADNDAVFRAPSSRTVNRIRQVYGVRWLFVDRRLPVAPDLDRYATRRYGAGACVVYELRGGN